MSVGGSSKGEGARLAILPGQASDANVRALAALNGCDAFAARQLLARPYPMVERHPTAAAATERGRKLRAAGFRVIGFPETTLAAAPLPRTLLEVTVAEDRGPPFRTPGPSLRAVAGGAELQLAPQAVGLVVIGRLFEERIKSAPPAWRAGQTIGGLGQVMGGALGGLLGAASAHLGDLTDGGARMRVRSSQLHIDLHGPGEPFPVRISEGISRLTGPGFPAVRTAEVTLRALLAWLRAAAPACALDDGFEAEARRQLFVAPTVQPSFDEYSAQAWVIGCLAARAR